MRIEIRSLWHCASTRWSSEFGLTFPLPLDSVAVVNSIEDEPSGHREQNPDHAEEGRLEAKEGHDEGEESPDEFADLEVERLDHPNAVEELERLRLGKRW